MDVKYSRTCVYETLKIWFANAYLYVYVYCELIVSVCVCVCVYIFLLNIFHTNIELWSMVS